MTREQLKKRLDELDRRIATVEQWGAVLTALNEQRQRVLAELGAMNDPPTKVYPNGVHDA